MKRRIIASVMAALMAVSLAGCGSQELSNEYITVAQYEKLEVPAVEKVDITDEYVEQYIQDALSSSKTQEEITDRASQMGDVVDIDYTGSIDGVEFEGGSAQGAQLELGSNSFIGATEDYAGFEEQVAGHNIGEEFDIEVQFPSEYPNNPDMQDQVAVFHIVLNKIYKQTVPELTDEWVKQNSDTAKTVDEFRKELKKELIKGTEESRLSKLAISTLDALAEKTTINTMPEGAMEEQIETANEYYQNYATAYGLEFADFCEQVMGMTEEDYNEQVKIAAELNIKKELACKLIAEKKNLEPSEEEYAEQITEFAAGSGFPSEEEFIEQVGEKNLKNMILQDIVGRYLAESCKEVETAENIQP